MCDQSEARTRREFSGVGPKVNWPRKDEWIQNIRRASFAIHRPRIFNSLPQYIRDTTKCDTNLFKAQLDKYLEQVPDQPLIPGYTAYRQCESNSLIDWSRNAQLKAKLEDPLRAYYAVEEEVAVHSDLGQ